LAAQVLSAIRGFHRIDGARAVCDLPIAEAPLTAGTIGYWNVRSYWSAEQARIDKGRPVT
jgi:hypothetical protein